MLAYHNKQEVKDKYVNRMIAHRKADEVVQGTGYDNGRGCAVGCTLNNYNHKAFESELGVPEEIAHLFDRIFEGVKQEDAPKFAQDVLEAIPVGADLSLVGYRFKLWLLKDKEHGVYRFADAQGKKAINQVATLLRRKIAGVGVRKSSWAGARAAARDAARAARAARATEAAAWAAARDAARAARAARATEAAAWAAARDAARATEAAAWAAARDAARAAASAAAWATARDAASAAAWATARDADAARAAASAASDAAWATARDAASAAAWEAADASAAAYSHQAIKLIELLKEAPINEGE